jgi:hypothetical protein
MVAFAAMITEGHAVWVFGLRANGAGKILFRNGQSGVYSIINVREETECQIITVFSESGATPSLKDNHPRGSGLYHLVDLRAVLDLEGGLQLVSATIHKVTCLELPELGLDFPTMPAPILLLVLLLTFC